MELAKVVFRFREIERPKDVNLSNWNQKYLTLEQMMYAVVDPYVSSKIGDQLGYVYFGLMMVCGYSPVTHEGGDS